MTGLDCLRKEMERRGLSKAQIESKVAAVVLDIVANSGYEHEEVWRKEYGESQRLNEICNERRNAERQVAQLQFDIKRLNRELKAVQERRDHCEDYIDEFNKSLQECETADGRDAMRIAQMFTNSVSIDTKYDNTAYIIGLAGILSGKKINPTHELKKINKRFPTYDDMVFIDP